MANLDAATSPWVAGDLILTPAALKAVEADVLRGYRERSEACGYLCGPAEQPLLCDQTVVMENLANKLHKLDPEQYFRTADTFFAFNEKRFDNAVRAGLEQARPVKVLYHSHLDVGAYFSPTDKAVMSMGNPPASEGGDGQLGPGPAWPLAFLVASVRDSAVDDFKLFVWRGSDFVESPFGILDAAGGA